MTAPQTPSLQNQEEEAGVAFTALLWELQAILEL